MAIKKLIEVALPLDSINQESIREKNIRFGHPSTLHLWWARRPLAAARAVIWASLIDDPSSHPELFPTEEDQSKERQRLFSIIEKFVSWDNLSDHSVIEEARKEIEKYNSIDSIVFLDPFAGGGAIPLEAQRFGLTTHAHDLNPVAVLINKATIEIPPRFCGCYSVNPIAQEQIDATSSLKGCTGLADDVRYYGSIIQKEAQKRIGHLYPLVDIPKEKGGGKGKAIAWIWVRTIKCQNPACKKDMPLASTTYCYLPRLASYSVLEATIRAGVASDESFAIASAINGDRYAELRYNTTVLDVFPSDYLVKVLNALKQINQDNQAKQQGQLTNGFTIPGGGSTDGYTGGEQEGGSDVGGTSLPPTANNTHFFMSVKLDNTRVIRDLQKYLDEVITHLSNADNSEVELSLEVSAHSTDGFPQSTVRAVSENCRTLHVNNFGFES